VGRKKSEKYIGLALTPETEHCTFRPGLIYTHSNQLLMGFYPS